MSATKASKGAVFLDDRGRALEPAPRFVLTDQVRPRRFSSAGLAMWSVAAIGAWSLIRYAMNPQPLRKLDLVLMAVFALLGPVLARIMTSRARELKSPLAAVLAAYRRCGACGYDLREIAVEEDGCVKCPECGGAWHRDRFVYADEDPSESKLVADALARGHTIASASGHDHRGLPLRRAMKWPPAWLEDAGPGLVSELRALARRERRRFLRWGAPCALAAWAGLTAMFYAISQEEGLSQIVLIGVITGIIAWVAFVAAGRAFMDRAMGAGTLTRLGVCGNCGRGLGRDAPAGFDGCVVCAGCRRAWRVGAEVARERSPTRPG